MIIGDSIQSGTALKSARALASFRLQRSANVVVHNFTSPGATLMDTAWPGMRQAVMSVRLLNGYFGMYGLIINIGHNDWSNALATVPEFSSAYGAFLEAIPQTSTSPV